MSSGRTEAHRTGPLRSANVRTLPESECYELLAVAVVGRIGFVSPAGVQIIPVNFRLGPGHRLFLKPDHPPPADGIAADTEHGRAVAFAFCCGPA